MKALSTLYPGLFDHRDVGQEAFDITVSIVLDTKTHSTASLDLACRTRACRVLALQLLVREEAVPQVPKVFCRDLPAATPPENFDDLSLGSF